MSSAAAAAERERQSVRPLADRLLAAVPLLTIYAWVALVCAWQAWLTPTPSIFPDELQYAELARAIAEDGRPALRGVGQGWASLPSWLTAPAWLLPHTADGYLAAKLVGVLAMASVVFPAYGLARLVAPRRLAMLAAAGAAAVPALSYSAVLMQEPFAYPAATLAFFLGVRALARPTRTTVAAAAVAGAAAPLVREQLFLVPLVLLAAAVLVAWHRGALDPVRRRVGAPGGVAVALVGVAAVVAVHLALVETSLVWRRAAETPGALAEYGIWALGGLTVGLAALPVVATAAVAATRGDRPADREWVAFVAVLAPAVLAFVLYTGAKVAYLAETWMAPVEERNVIYLAPLFLAGTARWLARPRVPLAAVAGAALATLAVVRITPAVLELPYFEAPGFALLAVLHDDGRLSARAAADAEVLFVAAAAAVLVVARAGGTWPRRVASVAAAGCLALLAAGEVAASSEQRGLAEEIRSESAQPLDWLDREADGRPVLYVAREIDNVNPFMTLEFWNESLRHVGALGGVPPPPGFGYTQAVVTPDGRVFPDPGVELLVTDAELAPVATLLTTNGRWRLYDVDLPLRLRDDVEGVTPDGWASRLAAYSRFAPTAPGSVLEVQVGRAGWTGPSPRSQVVVRSGPLAIAPGGGGTLAGVTRRQVTTIGSGEVRTIRVPAPRGPFRVEVAIARPFVPAQQDPSSTDTRELGAQVAFGLVEPQ